MAAVRRFYCPIDLVAGQPFDLPETIFRHGVLVLRLKICEKICLFTGKGGEFEAEITAISRHRVQVQILGWHDIERESPLSIRLIQALSSADKMDYTVQKACELGISHIVPLCSERSVLRLEGERAERRVEHWRAVAAAACAQCGRNRLPEISPITDLAGYLTAPPTPTLAPTVNSAATDDTAAPLRLCCLPQASMALSAVPQSAQYEILIGPEGGLAPQEIAALSAHNFTPVSLGPRILRTETAGIVALSILQFRAG